MKKYFSKRNDTLNRRLMESWGYGIPTPINEQDWDPVGYTMGMKQAITDAGGDPENEEAQYYSAPVEGQIQIFTDQGTKFVVSLKNYPIEALKRFGLELHPDVSPERLKGMEHDAAIQKFRSKGE